MFTVAELSARGNMEYQRATDTKVQMKSRPSVSQVDRDEIWLGIFRQLLSASDRTVIKNQTFVVFGHKFQTQVCVSTQL